MSSRSSCLSSDGVKISYQIHPNRKYSRTCIILIHGFSGSSEYFRKNSSVLAEKYTVIAYDLRGHGESGRPAHGYHVSRLAADLHDLIKHIKEQYTLIEKFAGVGCSIGAAVLWSYVEHYGEAPFFTMVFVDQAPLQNYAPDWGPEYGNYGCHDAASLAWAQAQLTMNFEEANRALVRNCLGYRYEPREYDQVSEEESKLDEDFFTRISAQCDPHWLAKLLADHTQYDHRDTLGNISIPCFVLAGQRSGCFPTEGCRWSAKLISQTKALVQWSACGSGHWLFYEDPDTFNEQILIWMRNPLVTGSHIVDD